ncbi:MAG: DUF4347 domain-containing protein [Hormoscilla sp.]
MNTTFDRLHFDARSTCAASLNKSKTLVFIDANVDDCEYLAAGIYDSVEAYVLDSDRDGMDQITAIVEKQSDKIDAIHIVSHGSPGCLYLGNAVISEDTLHKYHSQLQVWKNALSQRASILLYGCCVAYARGSEFVKELRKLTGKAIAAAVDYTGNAALGGSWNLDYTTGPIAAAPAFKPETMAGYGGLLGTVIVTNINDSGPGSLREAIALAADGDTIEFDPSLASQTITLTSGQLEIIDKNIIIDAVDAPGLTISGNEASRVIDVQATNWSLKSIYLTLRNLTIADGRVTGVDEDGSGGGLRTASGTTLTIEKTFFENNYANGEGGGAIFAGFRSTNTVIDSHFEGNTSLANHSATEKSERGGGAIAVKSESTTAVNGSTFRNNNGISGGAINTLLGELTVDNSVFIGNDTTVGGVDYATQQGFGGAIYTDGASAKYDGSTSGTIRISNSHFEDNIAAGQGGAMRLEAYGGDTIIVENNTIINNRVIQNSIGSSNGGGLMLSRGWRGEISNTTFANNVAEGGQGGGLFVSKNVSEATISNSTFSGNRATTTVDGEQGWGGGLTLNTITDIDIINTTVANNYAESVAGGFFRGGSNVTIVNSIAAYNVAQKNRYHQTNAEFTDGGGNIQFSELNDNDFLKIAAGVTIADPKLAPLQEINGVLVHPLLPGSPAIDAGVNAGAPATDQRGVTRDANTDIGAYEAEADEKSSHVRPDFNGDGKADILLRDSSGNNAIWLMDGTTQLSDSDIPFADNNLQVQGIIDFDGDGKSDILWRHSSTGENSIWLMDGPNRISDNSIPNADSNWQVAATDDFNGDGKGDIFWRDPLTGENSIWLMDGSNRLSNNPIGNAGSNWQVEGTGDFDGDSKADIIWRNSLTNVNTMWLMNGDEKIGDSPIGTTTWEVESTGDFNGDGKDDIFWRHSTGNNAIWLMDGTTRISGGSLPRVDTSWSVQGVSDFDADGKADILWRQNTGRNDIWLMDGINQVGGASIPQATTDSNLIL